MAKSLQMLLLAVKFVMLRIMDSAAILALIGTLPKLSLLLMGDKCALYFLFGCLREPKI